jgi:hypothetical protein
MMHANSRSEILLQRDENFVSNMEVTCLVCIIFASCKAILRGLIYINLKSHFKRIDLYKL